MHTGPARSLRHILLLVLLATTGPALAAPCAEMTDAGMASEPPKATEPAQATGHAMHCDEEAMPGHCDGAADNTDCDQACNCCPGHCATALPTADGQPVAYPRGFAASSYRAPNSSPDPEAAIRPPILS